MRINMIDFPLTGEYSFGGLRIVERKRSLKSSRKLRYPAINKKAG